MAFRVGQRVVLVGWNQSRVSKWRAEYPAVRYPEVGDVYTVRGIEPCEDSAVLLLEEIDNSHLGVRPEPGFGQEYFRPVAEPKTRERQLEALGEEA